MYTYLRWGMNCLSRWQELHSTHLAFRGHKRSLSCLLRHHPLYPAQNHNGVPCPIHCNTKQNNNQLNSIHFHCLLWIITPPSPTWSGLCSHRNERVDLMKNKKISITAEYFVRFLISKDVIVSLNLNQIIFFLYPKNGRYSNLHGKMTYVSGMWPTPLLIKVCSQQIIWLSHITQTTKCRNMVIVINNNNSRALSS